MTTTTTMAELSGVIGTELGTSDWYEVGQEHVNLFAVGSAVIEREGGDKPVCIAEPAYRYYGG